MDSYPFLCSRTLQHQPDVERHDLVGTPVCRRGRGALLRAVAAAGPDGDFLGIARSPSCSSKAAAPTARPHTFQRCPGEGDPHCLTEFAEVARVFVDTRCGRTPCIGWTGGSRTGFPGPQLRLRHSLSYTGRRGAFLECSQLEKTTHCGQCRRLGCRGGCLQNDVCDEQVDRGKVDAHLVRYGGRLLGGADEQDALSQQLSPALMASCLLAGCTTLAFGYDGGSASGALHNLVKVGSFPGVHFGAMLQGWIVSSRWVGILAGTAGVCFIPTVRGALMTSGVFSCLGSLVTFFAPKLWVVILGRVLCGIGDGLSSSVLCQYTAEIAPPAVRGGAVAFQETSLVVGAIVGAISGHYWIASPGGWRMIWGLTMPLGAMAVISMHVLPEAPRSIFAQRLAEAHRGELQLPADSGSIGSAAEVSPRRQHAAAMVLARSEAERALLYVRGLEAPDQALMAELDAIETNVQATYGQAVAPGSADADTSVDPSQELSWRAMLASDVHRRLLLAGAVAMASPALTGHPALMNYATQVFQSVGFDAGAGSGLAIALYAVKLTATLPDFVWLDSVDRRFLMSWGLVGIAFSYIVCGAAQLAGASRLAAGAFLSSTIIYQASVGPLSWIVPGEAFPTDMRQRGSALVGFVYASSVLLVVQLHPWLQERGTIAFLAAYTGSSAVAYYLSYRFLPETRGKTLEVIEQGARSGELFEELDDIQRDPQGVMNVSG